MGIFSSVLLLIPILFLLFPPQITSKDYKDLIFKGCANQKFQDQPSNIYSQNLKSLFDTLLTQSQKTKFSNTSSGTQSSTSIFGLYQCRGDLTPTDCNTCVSQFPELSRKLCGDFVIAVRIQLVGCYMRYEVSGFMQFSSTDFLYKYCKSRSDHHEVGDDFEVNRDMGFEEVIESVGSNGGFNVTNYKGFYVLGQCEGDLSGDECRECVKTGFERVKVECGGSNLGQVYLHRCFVSYNYQPNGGAAVDAALGSPGSGTATGTKKSVEKTIAIVVGATAAAGFILAVLLCTRSLFKKKRVKHSRGECYNYY